MTSTINQSQSGSIRGAAVKVVSIVLIVVGSLTSIAAIALLVLFGPSGRVDSGNHQIASSAAAVVADISELPDVNGAVAWTGRPQFRLDVSGGNASGVFVGIGRTADVDRYLSGVAIDQVTDIGIRPFELRVNRVPGAITPAPPNAQTFWVTSATSTSDAEMSWPVSGDSYRVVIMNADGSPNLITATRLQLVVPNLFWLSLVALGVGVVFTAAGIVLLVRSVNRVHRHASL